MRSPAIPDDIGHLEASVVEHDAVLVIVDVLTAYLSSETNSYRDQDIRRALAPLAAMAERDRVLRHRAAPPPQGVDRRRRSTPAAARSPSSAPPASADGRLRPRRRRASPTSTSAAACSPSSRTTSAGSRRACRYRIVEEGRRCQPDRMARRGRPPRRRPRRPRASATTNATTRRRSCATCWPAAPFRPSSSSRPAGRTDGRWRSSVARSRSSGVLSPTGRLPRTDDLDAAPTGFTAFPTFRNREA